MSATAKDGVKDGPKDSARAIVDRFMTGIPHLAALGVHFHAAGPDWAELRMPYAPRMVAYPETGVVASGAIFTLMDTAAGLAVLLARGRAENHATLDLRCDYLRPAGAGRVLIGRAECYRMTRLVAFVRGVAHDGEAERPVANIAATFMFTDQAS